MSSITIKDVAERAGVSISTVHQALNGKKGVSEETRRRVCEIVTELGYQPNPMASNLKRKARRICLLLPDSTFFSAVWKGARDYLEGVPNMNIKVTELPVDAQGSALPTQDVWQVLERDGVDGVLMAGHSDLFGPDGWERLRRAGIAVALVGADAPESGRVFCAQPDYEIIGRTMAELVMSRIPPYGSIALCAGSDRWEAHAAVAQGFDAYLREANAPNRVYRVDCWDDSEESYARVLEMLSHPDVAACCSVLLRCSELMGRALIETHKDGYLFAVGSDLSPMCVEYLKSGVFDNIIVKNPYAQGYLGARALAEYLMLGRQPDRDRVLVGSEVVFRSNLPMYTDGRYQSLLR